MSELYQLAPTCQGPLSQAPPTTQVVRSVPLPPVASKGAKVQTAEGIVFSRGERVFHEKFGYGAIIHIDGHKLDIAFEKSGTKRVMDSFIQKVSL